MLAVMAGLSSVGPAHAVGRWTTSAQHAAKVERAHIALAASGELTTLWVSLVVSGDGATGALVLPAQPGTQVDLVSDAWLRALEVATAPRILPPVGATVPDCGSEPTLIHCTVPTPDPETLAPSAVATFTTADALLTYAHSRGWALDAPDVDDLTSSFEAARFVVLSYELPPEGATTQTMRLRMPGAWPTVRLHWLQHDASTPVPLTLHSFGSGRAKLDGFEDLASDDVETIWVSASDRSNYPEQARVLLEQHLGQAALRECSGTNLLYSWTVLPDQVWIAPLAQTYFELTHDLGDTACSVDACLADLWRARARATPVSETCASGGLARVPLADDGDVVCEDEVLAGETDAALLRCEGADEFAYACAGVSAQELAITRHRLLLTQQTPVVATVTWEDAPEQGPAVHADALDVVGCIVNQPEPWRGGSRGSGGTAPSSGLPTAYWGGPTPAEAAPPVHADAGVTCAGSTEPEPQWEESGYDSRDGSAQDEDEATCEGDSTGSTESDEETCSGDSSDAEYEEETCAGDSSDSAEYESDTCSGDGVDDTSSDCAVSRPRPRRPRLSLLTLGLVAVWLPLRRIGRRRH